MENYPIEATEKFDNANFHRKYCMSFVKKFIKGEVLEVGAGCGSFTTEYIDNNLQITLTELDNKNYENLKNIFVERKNVKIIKERLSNINKKFDTIIYLHVLEHIKDDKAEMLEISNKLKTNGNLIIIVPRFQKLYSSLDKAVGHYRRYEIDFFKKKMFDLNLQKLISLDSMGYLLYYLNKIIFKNEEFPSELKIFIWDKIFTPITVITDFLTNYKIGKCILTVYKK